MSLLSYKVIGTRKRLKNKSFIKYMLIKNFIVIFLIKIYIQLIFNLDKQNNISFLYCFRKNR